MPVAATARPLRRPVPRPQPEARPSGHLRVVGPRERSTRRLTPAAGVALTAALFAVLLALAVSHTVLAQGQLRLDALDSRLAAEQARYAELRTEVAEMESPGRIVTAAAELGMVSPAGLVYLQPTSPDPTTAPADGSTEAGAVAGSGPEGPARDVDGAWSTIKPLLDGVTP